MESYYKLGDRPGNWITCPLGRICREHGVKVDSTIMVSLLGKSVYWINGYLDGFDDRHSEDRYIDKGYEAGYVIGKHDRELFLEDEKKIVVINT